MNHWLKFNLQRTNTFLEMVGVNVNYFKSAINTEDCPMEQLKSKTKGLMTLIIASSSSTP